MQSYAPACMVAGVSENNFSRWMCSNDPKFADFQQLVTQAEARVELVAVGKIIELGWKDPNHLKWWLERKFPDHWQQTHKIKVEVEKELREAMLKLKDSLSQEEYAKTFEILTTGERIS